MKRHRAKNASNATPPKPVALRRWNRPAGVAPNDAYGPDSVAVYRLFNVPGTLLYVGISSNPKLRFGQHADEKTWWSAVSRWTVDWFPNRDAALAEEARAIHEERPAFNLLGVPTPADDIDPRRQWVAELQQKRPTVKDLNALFLAVVQARSLPNYPPPRIWDADDALDIYIWAKDLTSPWTLRHHRRWITAWNDQQREAWEAHYAVVFA